jgi:DNA-binding IclR family transcriptional regulator
MDMSSRIRPVTASDGTQSVARVVTVLKLLAEHRDPGLRFVDVARLCGLEQPTVHRMLKALEREEMVARDPVTRRYRLGSLVFELGLSAAGDFNLVEVCRPSLQRLADATGDTSFLFIRRGNDAVCIDRIQGHYPIQTPVVIVGSRQPLGVNAGGLAMLQALSDEEIAGVMDAVSARLGAYGEFDVPELHRALAESRKRGYAAIGEKAVPGVTAIGLPVRNTYGAPAAALTIAATSNRMTLKRQQEILPALQQEVLTVQRLLYR